MRATRRGFTLIELLLVIAIIGLLVALIMQGGGALREAANRARCATNLSGLQKAYMAYVEERCNGNFPPFWHRSEWSGNDQYAGWLPIDPNYRIIEADGGRSYNKTFGPLVFEKYVKSADVFVCPTLSDSGNDWWHEFPRDSGSRVYFHDSYTNWDPIVSYVEWMKGNRATRRYTSASYSLRFGLYPRSRQWLMDQGVNAFIADNFHYHYPDEEDAEFDIFGQRHVKGVNVAYIDGSVEFRSDSILFTDNYDRSKYRPLSSDGGRDITKSKMWAMWSSFDKKSD